MVAEQEARPVPPMEEPREWVSSTTVNDAIEA
jgi:hypothetical protein